MGFIDKKLPVGPEVPVCPGVGRDGVPDLADPLKALGVLDHAAGIERNVPGEILPVAHDGLDAHPVPQRSLRQPELPAAAADGRERRILRRPVIELARQIHPVRAGRPLAVNPAVVGVVEAVVFVGIGKIGERSAPRQHLMHTVVVVHAQVDVPLKRAQRLVPFQDPDHGMTPSRHTMLSPVSGHSFSVILPKNHVSVKATPHNPPAASPGKFVL